MVFFLTNLFSFTGEQFHRAPQAIMPEVELVAIFVSHLFKIPYHIKMPTTWAGKGSWSGHWMPCSLVHCQISFTVNSNVLSGCKCPNYSETWRILDSRTITVWLESPTHIGMALHQWNTVQCLLDSNDSHQMAAENPCSPFVKNG